MKCLEESLNVGDRVVYKSYRYGGFIVTRPGCFVRLYSKSFSTEVVLKLM